MSILEIESDYVLLPDESISKDRIPKHAKNLPFLITLTCISSLGGFLDGYSTSVIGGALIYIRSELDLTDFAVSIIVSITILGALVGSIAAGVVADKVGRRTAILLSDLLFALGAVLTVVYPVLELII
jgi:major inositol transporter-like SP family MFS transporter